MRYRWKTGMLAWILFRVTGLALVGYLALHIMVISNLHDPNKFNNTMHFLGSWQFRILELGLFLVVLYHALNGIRVIIIDFFNGAVHQARIFWGLAALGFVLFIAGAYPMVSHALYWKDVESGKTKHHSTMSKKSSEEDPMTKEERVAKYKRDSKRSRRISSDSRQSVNSSSKINQTTEPNSSQSTQQGGLTPDPAAVPIPPVPVIQPIEPVPTPKGGKGK